MRRNSLILLLQLYEILVKGPQTFYAIRTRLGVGYTPLRKLLDELEKDALVHSRQIDGKTYYQATDLLVGLFTQSFYDGLKRFAKRT